MAFYNEHQFLNILCPHLDPPRLNHYHRHFMMLQALYIHHTKKKVHLYHFILSWVLQIFLIIFLTNSTSTFTSVIPLFMNSIRLWQRILRWYHFWCRFTIWRKNFICLNWGWIGFCRFSYYFSYSRHQNLSFFYSFLY